MKNNAFVMENRVITNIRKQLPSATNLVMIFVSLALTLAAGEQSANAQRGNPPGGLGIADLSVAAGDVEIRSNQWFVRVTVTNGGDADAPPFEVRITDIPTNRIVRTVQVAGLIGARNDDPLPSLPGGSRTLEFLLSKSECKLDLAIEADPDRTIKEVAFANNRAEVSFDECARFDWIMPDRFGKTVQHNDCFVGLKPPKEYIHPSSWKVNLNACAQPSDARFVRYRWEIDGKTVETLDCVMIHEFPALGTYLVKLTATTENGNDESIEKNVVVRDLLIVSIGDSIASGEGNPDERASSLSEPNWTINPGCPAEAADKRCHRSFNSGPAQAALALETGESNFFDFPKDKTPDFFAHSSVTFISLACSGAGILQGLLGGYDGQQPPPGTHDPLPPQIVELRRLLCPNGEECKKEEQRSIDALLISVGANDVHFSRVVEDCALGNCGPGSEVEGNLITDLNNLFTDGGRFDFLNAKIQESLKYSSVYITEYPDVTHNDSGGFCDIHFTDEIDFANTVLPDFFKSIPGVGTLVKGIINEAASRYVRIRPRESRWAFEKVIGPLNDQIRDKSDPFGWVYVDGIASEFFSHGYCTDDHWIVRMGESLRNQINRDGVMHPNMEGQAVYARRLYEEVSKRVSTSPNLEGVLDRLDCEFIAGWAWDNSRPNSPILVDVYDGSSLLMTLRADQFRPDLLDHGKGNGNHAFVVPLPMGLRDGQTHVISVKISDADFELFLSPFTFTCGLVGYLDSADCDNLSGWAWDSTEPDVNISVDLYVDGIPFMSTPAANFRKDLLDAGKGNGDHGFLIPIPPALKDRVAHSISVRFSGTQLDLNGSPTVLSCSGDVPPIDLVSGLACSPNIRVLVPTGQPSVAVSYPTPVTLEGPPLFCSPPSGSMFPVGATTVTCRGRNTLAACTFIVDVIEQVNVDICLQDDSSGNVLKFNSPTGVYQFTVCNGVTLTGTGIVTTHGGVITLQDFASDHRVLAGVDTTVKKGTATIQLFAPSTTFTIADRNIENNSCACP